MADTAPVSLADGVRRFSPWIPMVVALALLHPGFGTVDGYTIWITAAIVVSSLSLIIDFADAAGYMRQRKGAGAPSGPGGRG